MWSCSSDTARRPLPFPFLGNVYWDVGKKVPRNSRATWSDIVRKLVFESVWSQAFLPLTLSMKSLYHLVMQYHASSFPKIRDGSWMQVPMWTAHCVNLWSYLLHFSDAFGWAPQLFLIYSTHNWVLFTILYVCRWLFPFKHKINSYWFFLSFIFLFRSTPPLQIILIF